LRGRGKLRSFGKSRQLIVEQLEDRSLPSVSLPVQLDFGTATSPVAKGAIQVIPVAYSQSQGFGWQDATGIVARNRSITNALTRDFHKGPSGSFLVDLGKGTYAVTVTLGDALVRRDRVSLWL